MWGLTTRFSKPVRYDAKIQIVEDRDGDAEAQLVAVLEAAPVTYAMADIETGRLVFGNEKCLEKLGYTREDFIGKPAKILYADHLHREELLQDLRENGEVHERETQFIRSDGRPIWMLLNMRMIEFEGRTCVLTAGIDITELKHAHEEIRQLNSYLEARVEERTRELTDEIAEREQVEAALRRNEERLRTVLDIAVDGIITADAEGRIETFSPAATRIFGYSPVDVIGKSIVLLLEDCPPAVMSGGACQEFMTYLGGREYATGVGHEVEGRRKDGSIFPMEISVSEGSVNGQRIITCIARDITDRKEAEAALHAAKEMAENASEAKSAFMSSMSHELRTPLNAVLGFSQLLGENIGGQALNDKQHDYVQQIMNAGEHLVALIDEVVDLTRVETGNLPISIQEVGLDEMFEECMALVKPLAAKRSVVLSSAISVPEPALVSADRTRLKQILTNLLSNAVKYNTEGGSVKLHAEAGRSGFFRLSVVDDGIGIAADQIEEIFKPFTRLQDERSETEGTGIGLAITRSLVELMNGSIGVTSEPQKGSTFWVELPIA